MQVLQSGGGAALFEFSELCAQPLGAADYLALALAFHTVFIQGIPAMSLQVSHASYAQTEAVRAVEFAHRYYIGGLQRFSYKGRHVSCFNESHHRCQSSELSRAVLNARCFKCWNVHDAACASRSSADSARKHTVM